MDAGNLTSDRYSVVVRGEDQGWTWIVTAQDGEAARGQAPDPETARRSGAFAAAACQALEKIGARRRF